MFLSFFIVQQSTNFFIRVILQLIFAFFPFNEGYLLFFHFYLNLRTIVSLAALLIIRISSLFLFNLQIDSSKSPLLIEITL